MEKMVARREPPDALRVIEQLGAELDESRRLSAGLTATLDRIAAVLEVFYCAAVTPSTLQPVLDLAVQLNPQLQRRVS